MEYIKNINGLNINIYENFIDAKLPTILFIHGFNDSINMVRYLENLPHNFNIVSLDLPGCGKSNWDPKIKIDIDYYSVFMTLFINDYFDKDKQIYVVAHSLGCMIALKMLENIPKISKTILIQPIVKNSRIRIENLLPNNELEAYDSYLKLMESKDNLAQESANKYAKKLMLNKEMNNKKFKNLAKQILNKSYIESFINKYYIQNERVLVLAGTKDFFIPLNNLLKTTKKFSLNTKIINNMTHHSFKSSPREIIKIIEEFIDN
ncbi:alpha/beta fold hydrolase [Mycoplasma sp. Mirounga ES2805-ORL]|uniref:alpha/beta fold hydrolase n=1 Tax=Mycoplasma sp. Mirounga ES2805-ORL TaxID=754514 RepID=UPI00197B9B2C|nr:alpha/beta fold hydrolase [Mycoplasma sp. Mirounga ES2805-ORL]QSF13546.1 alpha/beta fold hydrolase [Mycoplasma sp. Mirounga ES2805-ORL]